MLAYWNYAPDGERAARICPLLGDISRPDFGIGIEGLAKLAGETTHIIHCAASVKLNMTPAQAHSTAVLPTSTVLNLGRRCAKTGALRKIELISTVGVWGKTPGYMPERPVPQVREFHNSYEAAKSEAERLIWTEGDGLPITLHRPSMVVGESRSGRTKHFQIFYHLCEFLSGSRTFGIMPDLSQTSLDTIPVDWVADAICWSSNHVETAGRIFHLCSGPSGAIALDKLQDRVRQTWSLHGRDLPKIRRVNRRLLEWMVPLLASFVGEKTGRALRGLPPVLAYLAEKQGFSNTETARLLSAAGLPIPPVMDYLDPVLDYYLVNRARHS